MTIRMHWWYKVLFFFTCFHSENLIICFSFCTINHFAGAAVKFFFFQTADILLGMKTHQCLSAPTDLSFLFFPPCVYFPSSSSSLSTQGPGAGLSACQTARIQRVRQGWVSLPLSHSASQSVGLLPFSLHSVEVNISRGCMEKHFPFSQLLTNEHISIPHSEALSSAL